MQLEELQEILLAFSYKDEDQQLAYSSFEKLYRSFSRSLYGIAKIKLKEMGIYDEELLESAIDNTFLKVYNSPNVDFAPKNGSSVDSSFKAYMSAILKNEILDLLKIYHKKDMELHAEPPDNLFDDVKVEEDADGENMKLLKQVLNSMAERDREILLALYTYHEEGKKTPSEVLDTLSKTYGTSKVNIRKIKQRAEEKIVEFFSKKSHLKSLKNVK